LCGKNIAEPKLSQDVHEKGTTAEARARLDALPVIEAAEQKIGVSVPPSRARVPPRNIALEKSARCEVEE
jgi:hypothetical protein